MRTFAGVLMGLMLTVCAPSSVWAQTFKAGQEWTNTRTSVLTIKSVSAAGRLSGTYVNNAAGFNCQGKPYAVTGLINGDQISFTVHWSRTGGPDCNSITSWTGFAKGKTLATKWDLVYVDAGTGQPTIHSGMDDFTRTKP